MEVKKLELILAILFILAGLLGLIAKLILSISLMGITIKLPLSEKLNTPEEFTLLLQAFINKLMLAINRITVHAGIKPHSVKAEVEGSKLTLVEVIILLIAGIVALLIGAFTLKEDKKSLLTLLGGILLLVGPIYLLYLYSNFDFKLTEILKAANLIKTWLYPFIIIGLGLVLYSLKPLIEKETLARVTGIILLLAGITILVPRCLLLLKISSIIKPSLGLSYTSAASLPKVKLYYLPFIGSLLLLVGGIMLLVRTKKAE